MLENTFEFLVNKFNINPISETKRQENKINKIRINQNHFIKKSE
jgi:hypothetical protein